MPPACRRKLMGTAALMLALLLPGVLRAQSGSPDLIVTVRDVAGSPLPGLRVQLHAEVGGPALADTITDALGQATFSGVTVAQVRVVVSGPLPDGTPLIHPDRDAAGIVLFPGLAIVATALSLQLLGDGIRDLLDPRLRGTR